MGIPFVHRHCAFFPSKQPTGGGDGAGDKHSGLVFSAEYLAGHHIQEGTE